MPKFCYCKIVVLVSRCSKNRTLKNLGGNCHGHLRSSLIANIYNYLSEENSLLWNLHLHLTFSQVRKAPYQNLVNFFIDVRNIRKML